MDNKPFYATHRTGNRLYHEGRNPGPIRKSARSPGAVKIMLFLQSQSCCFTGKLTEEIQLAQSTISQHLKELKDAGLIQGDVMPPRVKYCINKEAWQEAKLMFSQFFK